MTKRLRAFFVGAEAECGQAIILIALTMLAMLMMVGLAIDAGQVYSARRAMQEAADAAAYAGSVTLYQGGTQAQSFAAAAADATRNGFTHDGTTTWVTIVQPTSAPYNTSAFVEVTIRQNIRTSLVPAEAAITVVTVHAISGAESLNNDYAIMALDRNATNNAFQATGATIALNGGGIVVNSTASSAATSGGNTWSFACPSTNHCNIDVAGGSSGSWPAAQPGSPYYFDGLRTGQGQAADPFAGYPKPSTSGMATNPAGFGPGSNTVGQGIYTSTLSGKKLCHGTYILKGGGMGGDIGKDTSSIDPATGQTCDGRVLIFNTMSNYPASGGACTGVSVTGNHEIDGLLPPSSGTYKGMVFYQDPACTQPMSLGSTAFEFQVQGTIYLPNAAFIISGGHPEISGGQIVAKTVDLGAAEVTITFNSSTSAQPVLPRLAK